jgi:hypothetical protein
MRLHCLAFVLLAALPAAAPCAALPKAQFATTRCNYGDRLPGVLPPAVFPVTNRGDAPLVLRPQPCCGLTITGAETPVPPGATRRLVTRAAHPLGEGLFRKTVRVLTNDPGVPEVQIELVAMGKNPIQLFPGDELTFPLHSEFIPVQTVVLRSNDEPELRITSIRCSAPYLRCREVTPVLQEGSNTLLGAKTAPAGGPFLTREEPGRQRAVEVSVTTEAPESPYAAVVVLGTTCKRRPQVKLRVYGLSPTAVTAQPPLIVFDPIGKGEETGARMVVLTRAMGPFKLLGAAASDSRMELQTRMDPSGMFAELLVTFRPGKQRGLFRGTITVRTDDPERPRILIPYSGEAP